MSQSARARVARWHAELRDQADPAILKLIRQITPEKAELHALMLSGEHTDSMQVRSDVSLMVLVLIINSLLYILGDFVVGCLIAIFVFSITGYSVYFRLQFSSQPTHKLLRPQPKVWTSLARSIVGHLDVFCCVP